MAFDGDVPVGAVTVVGPTEGLNMLYGRKDACVFGIFVLRMPISIKESDRSYWIWE